MTKTSALLVASLGVLCGCGERSELDPVVVAETDTLIRADSELVGTPVDLAVGGEGRVFLLDYLMNRVLVFDGTSGDTVRLIGGPGTGPGEFRSPRALGVHGDTLHVVDSGNGRMQVFAGDGSLVRSHPLPVRATAGRIAVASGGKIAIADMESGARHLVTVVGPGGTVERSFGDWIVEQPVVWNFVEIKKDIRKGRIPTMLRNAASPVIDEDGSAWLVLVAEGKVQRYDPEGMLAWSRLLNAPEITSIREAFFEKNRQEQRPNAFFPLSYVADAIAVGDRLWMLINTPEDRPAVVLVSNSDGSVEHRLVFPGAAGARQFAVDRASRRVYFAITSAATVVGAPLPDDVRM